MSNDGDSKKYGFDGINDMADTEPVHIVEPAEEPHQESHVNSVASDQKEDYQGKQLSQFSNKASHKDDFDSDSATINKTSDIINKVKDNLRYSWVLLVVVLLIVVTVMPTNNKSSGKKYSENKVATSNNTPQIPVASKDAKNSEAAKNDEGIKFEKPPYGSDNVLNIAQLHWCIREGIRIEAIRPLIKNNDAVSEFNEMVEDYNSRCGSFRYREGALEKAKADVEKMRDEIEAEAVEEAKQKGWTEEKEDLLSGVNTDGYPSISNTSSMKSWQSDAGGAIQALRQYHLAITMHDYMSAYNMLTYNEQNQIGTYSSYANGFRNTDGLSSQVQRF